MITSISLDNKEKTSSMVRNVSEENINRPNKINDISQENIRKEINMALKQENNEETYHLREDYHHHHHHHHHHEKIGTDPNFKRKIVWFNTLGFIVLHLAAVVGLPFFSFCKVYTIIWSIAIAVVSGEGVTLGAHRLYSHKAFKATQYTKAVLLILQTIAGQNCMYIWVRDHRQHHKFSDTDADPHNANRGFFFSHMGWLMSRKHPEVIRKGKTIDMSDLEADKLVMFQKKYYKSLYGVFALAIPILTPVLLWNENIVYSFFVSYMTRYIIILNITWLVNSAAHVFGTKPYDRRMRPVESAIVALVTGGEGWHNYHHIFPWDYRAAELGMKYNLTTTVINILAHYGFVYDLKTAPYNMIEHRVRRTGDGTHRTIRPIGDVARESQNAQQEIDCSAGKNEDIEVREGGTALENYGGVVETFEKCMNLLVDGLEGHIDERNLKDDIKSHYIVDNNNFKKSFIFKKGQDICSKIGKFELCDFQHNMIRQRPS